MATARSATEKRIARARRVMKSIGVQGVPALVWPSDKGLRLLPGQWLFNDKSLARQVATLA